MSTRALLSAALLALLALLAGCTHEDRKPATPTGAQATVPDDPTVQPAQPVQSAPAAAAAKVIVSFFHEPDFCATEKKVEGLCRKAIEAGFAAELKSGAVVYRVLSSGDKANEHYLDEYDIGSKALVVSRQDGGKDVEFVACHDIWLLIEEPQELTAYVQKPIRDYLAKQ